MEAAPVNTVAGYGEGLTYAVVNSGTQKQKPKLVDSQGYTDTVKRQTPNYTDWTCSV